MTLSAHPPGMLLGFFLGSGTVSRVQGDGGWVSCPPRPWIWTMCLNSALLANTALHPALLLPAAPHGLHSTRQLCFHRQTGLGKGQALCRGAVSLACVTEAAGSQLRICSLCFLSLSTLWQVLARTDARAAKGRTLNQSNLPTTFLPSSLSQGSGLETGE